MRGLGKFSHEGLHPLMECNLLFTKIFHLSSRSLNLTVLLFFFCPPLEENYFCVCWKMDYYWLEKKIWFIDILLESKNCNLKNSNNHKYVTNGIQFRKYSMHQCLVHRSVTGKLAFYPGGKLMTIYPALSFWYFSRHGCQKTTRAGGNFSYIIFY